MFSIELNQQQKLASSHKDGPAIVLAVAGAGKTTTLCARTANLIIEHNVDPKRIKTMTFSRAAAKDMKDRFIKLFGKEIKNANFVSFSTIHSFAYSVINYYYKQKNIPFIMIENEEHEINKYHILREIYRDINKKFITEEELEELLTHITYVKNTMLMPREMVASKIFIKNFHRIFETYENIKKENNYIDFDDMLTVMYSILLTEPELLKSLQNKYDYWQVDEFQDISKIQYEILKLLVEPKRNLFCVGDDDQTLYSWRGSNPKILLEFPKAFEGAEVYFMEENYRSSQDIVRLSNRIISLNQLRYKKNVFTNNDRDLPVYLEEFNNEKTQIDTILREIQEEKNYHEIAILYRNNFSAIPFIDALQEKNIPYYIRDHKITVLNHWIVKDILSFIEFAYNPGNIELFNNIYYKMNAFITKQSILYVSKVLEEKGEKEREKVNIFDILMTYPQLQYYQKDRILRIKHDFNIFREQNTNNFMEFIRKRLNYDDYLERQDLTPKEIVNNTIGLLEELARNVITGLEFRDKIKGLKFLVEEASRNRKKGVVLSTIHSAKGLEFDKVYVIDVINNVFPNASSLTQLEKYGDLEELEEERRAFYVALTRAKRQLKICTIKKRFGNTAEESIFVREVKNILQIKKEGINQIPWKNSKIDLNLYKQERNIRHKIFGSGYILSFEGSIATVKFDIGMVKKIDLETCLENNLLISK